MNVTGCFIPVSLGYDQDLVGNSQILRTVNKKENLGSLVWHSFTSDRRPLLSWTSYSGYTSPSMYLLLSPRVTCQSWSRVYTLSLEVPGRSGQVDGRLTSTFSRVCRGVDRLLDGPVGCFKSFYYLTTTKFCDLKPHETMGFHLLSLLVSMLSSLYYQHNKIMIVLTDKLGICTM